MPLQNEAKKVSSIPQPSSIPLPLSRTKTRARRSVRFKDDVIEQPRMSKLSNMFSTIWRSKEKRKGKELKQEQVEEAEVEEECVVEADSVEDVKEEPVFARSAFRQSVKRAIGWRKSQRKAINKRKKENLQNSKLLTGRDSEEDDGEFYDDDELDAVVVEVPGKEGKMPEKSRIPKRRQSMKRPAVSIKSAGFLSQTVTSKKAVEAAVEKDGAGVTARKNKASALREQAARKKREEAEANSSSAITIKEPVKKPKPRASFRMKKGISRKPLHATNKKEPIKPAENKASRLRAMKNQESEQTDTPRPRSGSHNKERKDSVDETSYINNQNTPSEPRFSSSAIKTPAPDREKRSKTNEATPPKPHRTRLTSTPTPNNSRPSSLKKLDKPKTGKDSTPSPETPIKEYDKSPKFSRRFSGRAQKFSPASSPATNAEGPFNFIPIQTPSEPSEVVKRNKIDEVKRKRKITRPTSNIFDSFDNDYIPSSPSTPDIKHLSAEKCDKLTSKSFEGLTSNAECKENCPVIETNVGKESYPIITEPDIPKPIIPCKRTWGNSKPKTPRTPPTTPKTPRTPPNTPPLKASPITKPKSLALPKPTRSAPAKSRNNVLSARSKSYDDAGSDLECSGSSVEDSPLPQLLTTDDKLSEGEQLPILDLSIISSEDLMRIMNQLKTSPRGNKGSLRARRKVRSSWCVAESTFLDDKFAPPLETLKKVQKNRKPSVTTLDSEALLLEDLSSGHTDVCDTMASRTKAIRNVLAQWRLGDHERCARMAVHLSFPTHYPGEEFRTMRRICELKTDDYALFQNCLGILIANRETVTLPMLSILIPMVRLSLEVLGSDVLRGSVGDTIKLLTSQHGQTIMSAKAGFSNNLSRRLTECSECCADELQKIKQYVNRVVIGDCTPELMALQKSLELFGIQ